MSARANHRARPSTRPLARSSLARTPLSLAARMLLALLAGSAAYAQDTPTPAAPAEGGVLPTLTVKGSAPVAEPSEGTGEYKTRASTTATKMDLSNRETPQSISVITRAQIEDFSLHSANDVLSNTTGVRVERVETDRTYFSARGFDISNFQVDGLGLPFATGDQMGDVDTAAYDRVEVLRGANGLLSSTGNPSATVNFVRKRPTAKFQASAGLTVGSWDNRRLDGDVSGALNEAGTVRGRLVLAGQQRDSYLDRYSIDKTVLHGVIEADLGSDTVLTAGVTQQRNRPDGVMWGAVPLDMLEDAPRSASSGADWAHWNTNDSVAFAELSHALQNGWQVKGTVTHRELSSDAEMLYVYGTSGAMFTYPSKYEHTERQWLGDLYLTGPFSLAGREHQAVIGMNWSRSSNRLRSIYSEVDTNVPISDEDVLDGNFPKPDFNDDVDASADFTDYRRSLYGVARFNLSDQLKLFTGANLTKVSSSGVQYGEPHNYRKTKLTPYIGAVYDLDTHHSLYASYTKIFNPQSKSDFDRQVLPPIEGSNAEVGAKGEWFDQRLTGTLSIFQVKQQNTAADSLFNEDGGYLYYPTVDATSTGFELDVAGRMTPGWDISAGYTQLRLKDDDTGDNARTFVPRRTLRVSTTYRVPTLDALKLGMSVNWQSRTERAEAEQSAYALLDVMARYDFTRNLSAVLKVNNVTNKKYISSLYWAQNFYGAPRHATLSLNWKY